MLFDKFNLISTELKRLTNRLYISNKIEHR